MANPYFQFKQFTIYHDQCAMKVGTDGVLLGAWCNLNKAKTVLDIGTGTGLIALMIAQRSNSLIDAIDIDEAACKQAFENVKKSPFHQRINIYHYPLNIYAQKHEGKYDLIVSNPPYFTNSLKGPDKQRNMARHNDSLSIDELTNSVDRLLKQEGIFSLILPFDQNEILLDTIQNTNLKLIRETIIFPTPNSAPKRILAEFCRKRTKSVSRTELIIEETRHQYTTDYKELTKDFYLNM